MAKNKRKAAQAAKQKPQQSRRSFLAMAPYVAAGAVAVAGLGYWGVTAVRADLAEQDTSIVGQGTPTVVQVHNTTCAPCIALQRETRAALSDMEAGAIHYRVANIGTEDGLAFATQHGASYTTLLLFDGDGNLTRRIQGETPRNMLRVAFLTHIAAEADK